MMSELETTEVINLNPNDNDQYTNSQQPTLYEELSEDQSQVSPSSNLKERRGIMSDNDKSHVPESSDEPVNLKFNMNIGDRDPNAINTHLKVSFSDVFAEPHGTYSFDGIWRLSYTVFEGTKLWCYRIISAIFAIPMAIFCGLYFACLIFGHIWTYTPCIRGCSIVFGCAYKMITLCVQVCCNPVNESVGRIFSRFRLLHVNTGSMPTVKKDVEEFDENVCLTTASLKIV